jgi:hypothetical protein
MITQFIDLSGQRNLFNPKVILLHQKKNRPKKSVFLVFEGRP